MSKKIIIDCDIGVDDAIAIILAMNSPELEIIGITTTHGNTDIEQTTANALRFLDYFNSKIPVVQGSARPMIIEFYDAKTMHGTDGLGNTDMLPYSTRTAQQDAVEFICEKVRSGEVKTIVATAPLTNIAKCFQKYNKVMCGLDELIIMGGAIYEHGNTDRKSEFNFYADPHSAEYVLHQPVKKTLIPLDVTNKVPLTQEYINKMPVNRTTDLIKSIIQKYHHHYTNILKMKGISMHDPLAVAYAIDKTMFAAKYMDIKVECDGKYTRGTCVPEDRTGVHKKNAKPNVNVAIGINTDKFWDCFLNAVR